MSGKLGIAPEELERLLVRRPGLILAKAALLFSLWGALGFAASRLDSAWLALPLWILAGFFVNGLIQLAHDGWHDNLFEQRWANRLAGHLFGVLAFISEEALRHDHLMHHRYNRTEKDPDAYNAGRRSIGLVMQYYAVAFFGLPLSILYFNLLYPAQAFGRREWRRHLVTLGAYAVAISAVLLLAHSQEMLGLLLEIWLLPLLFASPFNGLKSLADHYANDWKGNRFRTATTTVSHPVVTFFWHGLNYHLDHHLFPRVPGHALPALHARIRSTLLAKEAPVFARYRDVWWAALKEGPVVVAEDVRVATLARRIP